MGTYLKWLLITNEYMSILNGYLNFKWVLVFQMGTCQLQMGLHFKWVPISNSYVFQMDTYLSQMGIYSDGQKSDQSYLTPYFTL